MFVELLPARIRCKNSGFFPVADFLSKYAFAQAPTIAATTAVPIPPKTSCQLSAMNYLRRLFRIAGLPTKPTEKSSSQQSITSGDGGTSFQSAGDMTVHNHAPPAPQSLIQRPTLEQVRKYDPKTDQ